MWAQPPTRFTSQVFIQHAIVGRGMQAASRLSKYSLAVHS